MHFWTHDGFKNSSSSDWENFGAYVGGVISPIMTFLTLMFLMKSNSEQITASNLIEDKSRRQRNLDNLFELINGFRSITYNLKMESNYLVASKTPRTVTGNEVFLHLYLKFRENYINIVRANLLNSPQKFDIKLTKNTRNYINQFFRSPVGMAIPASAQAAPFPQCLNIMQTTVNGGIEIPINYDSPQVKMFYDEIIELMNRDFDNQYIKDAFGQLYTSDGYLFGHYFRNFNYILEYINSNEFENKLFCFRYLRSVLSSYENVLLYYDCIYYSSANMVDIIDKQEILNDLNKQEFLHKSVILDLIYTGQQQQP